MSERLTESPELLRLGIDMDGVVADFNAGWIERYNRDFDAALHPDHVVGWDELLAGKALHADLCWTDVTLTVLPAAGAERAGPYIDAALTVLADRTLKAFYDRRSDAPGPDRRARRSGACR